MERISGETRITQPTTFDLRTKIVEVSAMHSIACFLGLIFLVIFALIAIPLFIILAKLLGFAIIGGMIALLILGIWKLFDLAEPTYRPY
jgi:hypothetical protein